MILQDTIVMMNSADFKERFRAEFFQLDIRIEKLSAMLVGYRQNTLNFTPKCDIKLLDNQLDGMKIYRTHLVERARIEGVDLSEPTEHVEEEQ